MRRSIHADERPLVVGASRVWSQRREGRTSDTSGAPSREGSTELLEGANDKKRDPASALSSAFAPECLMASVLADMPSNVYSTAFVCAWRHTTCPTADAASFDDDDDDDEEAAEARVVVPSSTALHFSSVICAASNDNRPGIFKVDEPEATASA